MSLDWTWFQYTWFAAALESFLAIALLLFASVALWRRFKSRLFLLAGAGFFVAILGNAFHTYIIWHGDRLCPSDFAKMAEFVRCTNSYAGLGSTVAATGLITAAIAFLIYAARK
jgi:hypothetical protein